MCYFPDHLIERVIESENLKVGQLEMLAYLDIYLNPTRLILVNPKMKLKKIFSVDSCVVIMLMKITVTHDILSILLLQIFS